MDCIVFDTIIDNPGGNVESVSKDGTAVKCVSTANKIFLNNLLKKAYIVTIVLY